jgi:ribosomal protein S18 acetylase RimI-like enzyme
MKQFEIRQMLATDLDSVMSIQAACYSGDIPESRTSLLAKFEASPETCLIAQREDQVLAYLFAMPWLSVAPPSLNANTCHLPFNPDCLYLHDLSVSPHLRGTGAGAALVRMFFELQQQAGLPSACLVAVQNSVPFWRRFGFEVTQGDAVLLEKLASYGADARFMQRQATLTPVM